MTVYLVSFFSIEYFDKKWCFKKRKRVRRCTKDNLVHGGINGESKEYLSDFWLFNFDSMNWEKVRIAYADPEDKLEALAMHTMSKIFAL